LVSVSTAVLLNTTGTVLSIDSVPFAKTIPGPASVATGANSGKFSVGDIDGDGDIDGINASGWFEQTPSGFSERPFTFAAISSGLNPGGTLPPALGRFDSDNDLDVAATYRGATPAPQFDEVVFIEFLGGIDCDSDGVNDAEAIFAGAPDCNSNGIPDSCDIAAGSSADQDGDGIPDECLAPPLSSQPLELSAAAGGTCQFTISAGADFSLNIYALFGSSSGSSPGISVGGVSVPLNIPDPYFDLTVLSANQGPFSSTFGILNGAGAATAAITIPADQPALAGLTLTHAAFVLGDDFGLALTTNPTFLSVTP
ncbi:MAG: hypothetical protein AAFY46_07825, partial [Planctomycetota bacterium]